MTNSRKSQSEKLATGGGRETAAKKPHNKRSQAYTTNGTRARGRRDPGQKPRGVVSPKGKILKNNRKFEIQKSNAPASGGSWFLTVRMLLRKCEAARGSGLQLFKG